MEDLILVLRKVNEEIYDTVSPSTRLGYCLHDEKMIIYSTINVFGEGDLRRAERFAGEFSRNLKVNVNFKRDYSNYRGSELTYSSPIFYVENVGLSKEEVADAANTIKGILEDFYNIL